MKDLRSLNCSVLSPLILPQILRFLRTKSPRKPINIGKELVSDTMWVPGAGGCCDINHCWWSRGHWAEWRGCVHCALCTPLPVLAMCHVTPRWPGPICLVLLWWRARDAGVLTRPALADKRWLNYGATSSMLARNAAIVILPFPSWKMQVLDLTHAGDPKVKIYHMGAGPLCCGYVITTRIMIMLRKLCLERT